MYGVLPLFLCHAQRILQEGAYADVEVKLGLVKILEKTFDVCEEA